MEHSYSSVFSLVEDFVKALEKMQEEDKQTWLPNRAIPCGFEDAIDSLKEHAEDVRDFDPCPDSDGEGGLIATARPTEWERTEHLTRQEELTKFCDRYPQINLSKERRSRLIFDDN